jgi:hypothetical protein
MTNEPVNFMRMNNLSLFINLWTLLRLCTVLINTFASAEKLGHRKYTDQ